MTRPLLTINEQVLSLLYASHTEVLVPAPNTTIQSTITVTDINNSAVTNPSLVSLLVTYPDLTTLLLTLSGGGVINVGNGQYQAKYATKGPGTIRELWTVTASDGTTTATFQYDVVTGY